ncbi:DUF4131 domain-containing protein [Porticoccaceae bacterium]|nr:DUF4131 domain-containing protein [Porticoccaceae bacterium]
MKFSVVLMALILCGCYGWEFPDRDDIQGVESQQPVARGTISEFEGEKGEKYIGEVIEVEGRILHIVNKAGQPAISIGDPDGTLGFTLVFGPNERLPIKELKVGDMVVFRGILSRAPKLRNPGFIDAAILSQ